MTPASTSALHGGDELIARTAESGSSASLEDKLGANPSGNPVHFPTCEEL